MTPEWLEEIEKQGVKAAKALMDEYTQACFYNNGTKQFRLPKALVETVNAPLLQACNTYRKAIEEAPHESHCVKVTGWQGVASGLLRCTCWKSQALSFNPTKKEVI